MAAARSSRVISSGREKSGMARKSRLGMKLRPVHEGTVNSAGGFYPDGGAAGKGSERPAEVLPLAFLLGHEGDEGGVAPDRIEPAIVEEERVARHPFTGGAPEPGDGGRRVAELGVGRGNVLGGVVEMGFPLADANGRREGA